MAPEVRVIGPDGEQMGVMSTQDALRRALDLDVDMVETVASASPPVVKLIDYGKFKYQEQKREAEAKSKQTVIEVKEIKLRPGTDEGDYQVKMRNIKRFLEEGDKVKVTLRFRGREITHQELGMAQLERIKTDLGDLITVESMPKLEGKQMIMMIAPSRKKVVRQPAAAPASVAAPAATAATTSAPAPV
ncbi:MAG: translation initiation factor IF-3 [Brachymonas sp.]|nr:translation initiation factor IF-3 [Brachymonas sp.]